MHTAKVVSGSVKPLGTRGIVFTTRCCDDPNTDFAWHHQQAAGMTADELKYVMSQRAGEHAARHKAGMDAVKLAEVIAAVDCPTGDCGCSGSAS